MGRGEYRGISSCSRETKRRSDIFPGLQGIRPGDVGSVALRPYHPTWIEIKEKPRIYGSTAAFRYDLTGGDGPCNIRIIHGMLRIEDGFDRSDTLVSG